jgi:hypothetical protein
MKFCVSGSRAWRAKNETSARIQRAHVSSDVAEVANRPKKRPGSRKRSSITMGATHRQAQLV